jgi:hypothetical protein
VAQSAFDPAYDPVSGNNDIGLLTLAQPLWASSTPPPLDGASTIAPVPLATSAADETPGTAATVFGWGYDESILPGTTATDPNGFPATLQSAPLSLISGSQCSQELSGTGLDQLQPSQLCASGLPSQAGACFGDSGGPLVVRPHGGSAPEDDEVVGLVDLGYGCGNGYPDIDTNVAAAEVQTFLASNPPQAPYEVPDTTVTASGTTITCNSSGWVGNPTLSYAFFADTNPTPTLLAGPQASPIYTVPAGAGGVATFCVATGTNAGGFGAAFSDNEVKTGVTPATTITTTTSTPNLPNPGTGGPGPGKPPSPLPTTIVLPSLHVDSHTCAKRRCTVVVTGIDQGGPGVATVRASLHELARVACRVKGHKSTCTRSVARATAVKPLSGERFQIAASGLPVGAYTLALTAVDHAGRLQARATTLSLRLSR